MTELFDALSVVGDPMSDEDRMVFLLASLPESYDMLVTVLKANAEVPKMEVVTEWLLQEERKLKDHSMALGICGSIENKGLMSKHRSARRQVPRCHHCGKLGHIRQYCSELPSSEKKSDNYRKMKQKANHAGVKPWDGNSSDSEEVGLTTCYMFSVCKQNGWIVDSEATSHTCNDHRLFI